MNVTELVVFIIYFVFMVGIGIYFFAKSKGNDEKDYFLGGRQMGPWVSALSAGASDMSSWACRRRCTRWAWGRYGSRWAWR